MKLTRLVFGLACASSLGLLGAETTAESPPISPEYFDVLRSGNAEQLRHALRNGASPNARDASGNTPLMLSAVYGDADCLRVLLEKGAGVNATNAAGATALMRATFDERKLALLLDAGADPQTRAASGNTALMLAARPWNSHRAVALLLAHGADPRATNNSGASALMAAAAGEDTETLRLLLRMAQMWRPNRGRIPFPSSWAAGATPSCGPPSVGTSPM